MRRIVELNQRRVPLPASVPSGDKGQVLIQRRAGRDPIRRRREAGAPDAQRAPAPSLNPERLVKQRADPAATTFYGGGARLSDRERREGRRLADTNAEVKVASADMVDLDDIPGAARLFVTIRESTGRQVVEVDPELPQALFKA